MAPQCSGSVGDMLLDREAVRILVLLAGVCVDGAFSFILSGAEKLVVQPAEGVNGVASHE